MSDSRPDDGDAELPDGDLVASLLAQRWPIEEEESIRVDVQPPAGDVAEALELTLASPRHRYLLRLVIVQAPEGLDRWALLVDGLDAMFGQLIENGRAHRELPKGRGVEFQGAELEVVVEHTVPELKKLADQILTDN